MLPAPDAEADDGGRRNVDVGTCCGDAGRWARGSAEMGAANVGLLVAKGLGDGAERTDPADAGMELETGALGTAAAGGLRSSPTTDPRVSRENATALPEREEAAEGSALHV